MIEGCISIFKSFMTSLIGNSCFVEIVIRKKKEIANTSL